MSRVLPPHWGTVGMPHVREGIIILNPITNMLIYIMTKFGFCFKVHQNTFIKGTLQLMTENY